jgi:cyclophilin family peptidyl-prolyl cis-trans isomerase
MTILKLRAAAIAGLVAIFAAVVFGATIASPTASLGADGTPHLILTLKDGDVDIQLLPDIAPKHVARIIALAQKGAYDGVVFHRVIDGFMAQTGDIEYGKIGSASYNLQMAGIGGSDMPDVQAEFSSTPYAPGIVGAARGEDPNSFNSQFFIMLSDMGPDQGGAGLTGHYTVFGKVVAGLQFVDNIKKGDPQNNGAVDVPDKIVKAQIVYK